MIAIFSGNLLLALAIYLSYLQIFFFFKHKSSYFISVALFRFLVDVVIVAAVNDHDDVNNLTSVSSMFDFQDLNECESGNNTCTTAQVCFNFQGGYTCLDPLRCNPPYIELSDK